MTGLVLTVSDHILALGIKFWTEAVRDHDIGQLDQCGDIISALQEFLRTLTEKSHQAGEAEDQKSLEEDDHEFIKYEKNSFFSFWCT